MKAPHRIGICTGGGDCPGLNSTIRAVVKHAIGTYQMEVVGVRNGLTGLISRPNQTIPLSLDDVTGLIDRGGTILGTSNKGSPFRDKTKAEEIKKLILESWQELALDAMVVIGGDGTHFMARHLSELGLNMIGIPKTIDNDLYGTEQTIGFSTAVEIATEAACRLSTSAEAHDRIMVLEVMGRDAGHIALQTGIASGANIVLIPEIAFSYDEIIRKLQERQKLGRHFSLVIVAEGAADKEGQKVFNNNNGNRVLGGVGYQVARELQERLNIETRVTVLGHIQRGGSPNAEDRILATILGTHAVELINRRKFGRIVGIRHGQPWDFPYQEVQDRRRLLDLSSSVIAAAEAVGISLGRPTRYRAPV